MRFLPFLLFVFVSSLAADVGSVIKSLRVDLDGDARKDKVQIYAHENTVCIQINRTELVLHNGFSSVQVVDTYKKDKYRELLIHTGDGLDYSAYELFRYTGKRIVKLGRLFSPTFSGNGIVYSNQWMGFWQKVQKWTLQRKKLRLVAAAQELFSVGVSARVKTSFPIFQKHSRSSAKIAYLRKKSRIKILVAYAISQNENKIWYLVRSSTGLIGWVDANTVHRKMSEVPWAG